MVRRRWWGALAAVTAVVLGSTSCDWASFRYSPDNAGSSPDTAITKEAVQQSMRLAWTAPLTDYTYSTPAVANGVAYIGDQNGRFAAFDATGASNCSGSPKTCAPLWTASTGARLLRSSPAVSDGVVYVGSGDGDGKLYAFDAAGSTNCSGSPKTCAPLWTAALGLFTFASPTVVDGIVYIAAEDYNGPNKLYAFDAAGTTNCTGTPKTCAPIWSADTHGGVRGSAAVVNGVVYVGSDRLYAFDAAGTTNCSGTPRTCTPLWSAAVGGLSGISTAAAVVKDVVYVDSSDHLLYAFDAAGRTNCAGTPATCAPLWTAETYGAENSSPAVANGRVFVGSSHNHLYGFDAAGITNCSGSPKKCTPILDGQVAGQVFSSPGIANGVVYLGGEMGLYAFDAAGVTNCTGTPSYCRPLWHVSSGGEVDSSPVVANGYVYVGSQATKSLDAYRLERIPPSTAVVSPTAGATVSGTTAIDATASDNVSVSRVEFRLSGGNLNNALVGVGTADGAGHWTFQWDTTTVANGTYTLSAVASDPARNVGRSAEVALTVAN